MKKIQLTDTHKEKLFQIPLFRDLPLNIKESLLEKLDFVIYAADKKEIVVTQGTPCNKPYVLLEGKLRTDIIDGLGNEVMIEYIIAPRTFATPHLFNPNNTLPATFTALEDSVILMATKDSTFKVISQDPQVLHNFLCIAGNCNICTVSRLKPLSRKTVRERFIEVFGKLGLRMCNLYYQGIFLLMLEQINNESFPNSLAGEGFQP